MKDDVENKDVEEVRSLLQKFQDGYTKRDASLLDEFMGLFIEEDALEVIGTNAVDPGRDEWCRGRDAVRRLVGGDWEGWGDVVYDVEGANIFVNGDTAWLSTTGTVHDRISVEDRQTGYLNYIREILAEEQTDASVKINTILKLGNEIALDMPFGEDFTWPLRLTAVAVRHNLAWKFHQMQFSFATTRAPDVRLETRTEAG